MKNIYFLFFLVSVNAFSQERTAYKGRVMATETQVFPLKIINLTTSDEVLTDVAGYFTMPLQPEDHLVLAENDYYKLDYRVRFADLQNNLLRLYPESLSTVLKEVEIYNVTTKSLGITPEAIKNSTYSTNTNMDFVAMFLWVIGKFKKDKSNEEKSKIETLRSSTMQNPYVAALPRTVMTDYLKIPDSLVEKFYYFMNNDYLIDQYIKSGDEPKWRMHLLDKSFQFLEQEQPKER